MKQIGAIIWIVLTVIPLIFAGCFINFSRNPSTTPNEDTRAKVDSMFQLHTVTAILIICLMISYIIYTNKTSNVPKDKKSLWIALLLVGNIFVMPMFWFLYVWHPLNTRIKD